MVIKDTERSTYIDVSRIDWTPSPYPIFEKPNDFLP